MLKIARFFPTAAPVIFNPYPNNLFSARSTNNRGTQPPTGSKVPPAPKPLPTIEKESKSSDSTSEKEHKMIPNPFRR